MSGSIVVLNLCQISTGKRLRARDIFAASKSRQELGCLDDDPWARMSLTTSGYSDRPAAQPPLSLAFAALPSSAPRNQGDDQGGAFIKPLHPLYPSERHEHQHDWYYQSQYLNSDLTHILSVQFE